MKKWSIKKSKNAKMLKVYLEAAHDYLPENRRWLVGDIQRCAQDLVTEVADEAAKILFAKYKKGNK